jgi:mitogen-activated protein kinase kinase kinase
MAGPSAPSSSASVTLGVNGRPAPLAALSSHPFATTPATPSSPSYPPLSSAHPPSDTLSSSTDSLTLSAPSSSTLAPSRSNSSLRSTGGTTPSLEDLKYKIVKFINPEDGNTRVVDVTDCSGGWEVLEKVLRKFGKWREGGSGARSLGVADDSDDEEGRGVVVLDGWGVYLEGYGGEGIGQCSR